MKKTLSVLLIAALLLSIVAFTGKASATTLKGPNADQLLIKIYASDTAEFAGFEAGDIDIVDWSLDPTLIEQYSTLPLNKSIVLGFYSELGMFEFDINNNKTIPSAPGVIQPTSDPWFRTALQYLVDKDYIVTTICQGLASRIDSPIPPALGDWYNPNVQHYGYDPATAEAILDAHGYTINPDTGVRINPYTGNDMDPLHFYIRADDTLRRTPAGQYFASEMQAIGIPVDAQVVDRTVCYQKVMVEYDFNLYTGGWSLSRDPDYLMWLWVSWMGPGTSPPTPWALNYNYFNDTLLDQYLETLGYAPDISTAKDAAWHAQARMMNRPDDPEPGISAFIPLWATAGYMAYRHPLVYAVNEAGTGYANWWTFLVAHFNTSDTGGTIRWGFKSDVQQLNPLYSQWVWDWFVLDKIYDSLISVNPYNLAKDMPWMASDWTVTTWANPDTGEDNTLLIFTLNDGITFHDGTPVTVDDVKFTIEYIKNYSDCWIWSNVADVHHVDVDPSTNKIYVYENITSVWALHWVAGTPILPKHIWETISDPHGFQPDPNLIGSGPYMFTEYTAGDHFLLTAYRDYFMPVHPAADVNIDMTVDIFDIVHVASSFGLRRGQPGFDPTADVTAAWDLVDIFDLVIVASHFGENWTPN